MFHCPLRTVQKQLVERHLRHAGEFGRLRDRRNLVRLFPWYFLYVDKSLRKMPQPASGADSGAIEPIEASGPITEEVMMLVVLLPRLYSTRHIVVAYQSY